MKICSGLIAQREGRTKKDGTPQILVYSKCLQGSDEANLMDYLKK
jgi:hypothetical protein